MPISLHKSGPSRGKPARSGPQAELPYHDIDSMFQAVWESASDALAVSDAAGIVLKANPAYYALYSLTPEEVLGHSFAIIFPVEGRARAEARYQTVFHGPRIPGTFETVIPREDGSERIVESRADFILQSGERVALLSTIRDITKRKQVEAQLVTALKDKQVLLSEVYHRVKNNLQVVSSLLNLQAGYSQDERLRAVLKDTRNRVRSMALIHEKLAQSTNQSQIDFGDYVHELVDMLSQLYSSTSETVQTRIMIENIYFGLDTAVPCGMIINELVSNSLKYAFPHQAAGQHEIWIAIEPAGPEQYVLVVADNGVGRALEAGGARAQTLGLQLVAMLAEQLRGKVELSRAGGTSYKITFAGSMYAEKL